MSRITETFASLKAKGEKALITYVAAGDPSLEASKAIVKGLAAAGADIVELGLAFSDPLADGPVIQAGSQRALAAGANTAKVFAMIGELRSEGVRLPILIMTYYNLLTRPGVANFCARAREAGVDGLIIPDVPMDEADELLEATRASGLDLVQFVAPTSTLDRIEQIARLATGFVYCVSLTGVTGGRQELPTRFTQTIEETRKHTATPIAVGFGVARPDQVRQVARVADGVIVGSAIVKLCGQNLPREELVESVIGFVRELKAATKV